MNKHLFKSLQKDKKTELDKLYNQYQRMKSFNDCIYKRQAYDNLTLSQYECFWSWYYNSNVTAREAYHYTFEDEQSSFYLCENEHMFELCGRSTTKTISQMVRLTIPKISF